MLQNQGDKNYGFKIVVLTLSTMAAISAIWWAVARQESVDWISAQITHQPSGYAISQTEDGRIIVNNVIKNFEITLPQGFSVNEGGAPSFYYQQGEKSICQIKSQLINYKKEIDINFLKLQDSSLSETAAGNIMSLKKEITDERGNFIYELLIPQNNYVIKFILTADQADRATCRSFFEEIRKSFIGL